MYNSFRIAKSIRKTLLWIYVKKDLLKIEGKLGIEKNLKCKFFSKKTFLIKSN